MLQIHFSKIYPLIFDNQYPPLISKQNISPKKRKAIEKLSTKYKFLSRQTKICFSVNVNT